MCAMTRFARAAVLGCAAVMILASRPEAQNLGLGSRVTPPNGIGAATSGQADISGDWRTLAHEDTTGHAASFPGEYLAIPLTDAARLRADSWNQSVQTLPEHQCYPHPVQYSEHSASSTSIRIIKEIDPVTQNLIAYRKRGTWMEINRTFWMDGRPHPPEYAAHTFWGFSTGKWEGAMLTVTTTHLKDAYVDMNGIPSSDKATVVEHFVRHGNYLTLATLVIDPVYLAEPYIKTSAFVLDPTIVMAPYPCGPNEVVVEVPRPRGAVPHWLPGTNKYLREFAIREGLPFEATRGYDEALYPEYMEKLKTMKPETAPKPAAAK
jgi:hypothetical protein